MPKLLNLLLLGFVAALCVGLLGWLMRRALRRSEDPARLIFKWIITALIGAGLLFFAHQSGFDDYGDAFAVPIAAAVAGLILTVIWGRNIGAMIASPLTSLFDGGFEEPDPQPLYSIAHARRKQAKYREAIYEIQAQLERFPNDVTGLLLMAEIQAEDLKDLQAAEITIRKLCAQPGHAPEVIAAALTELADWQIKYTQDIEAARQSLEEIVQRFPDSEPARLAAQRLAHLGTTAMHVASQDRPKLIVPHSETRLGLQSMPSAAPIEDRDAEAAELVSHLQQFPDDAEAREALAVLYAAYFQRIDLAIEQLELLVTQHARSPRLAAHYLNVLADVQVKYAKDRAAATATLERIIELFPTQAPAELAKQRLAHLEKEFRHEQVRTPIKLGKYEQKLGLKMRHPPEPGQAEG